MLNWRLVLALSLGFQTAAATARAANRWLKVGLDSATGQLVEFVDRGTRHNLVQATNAGGIWELEFAQAAVANLTPSRARTFAATSLRANAGQQYTWSEFGLAQAPRLRVVVTVRFDDDQPLSRWQIAVRDAEGLEVKAIRFPRLLNVREQAGERLAIPVWVGQQAENPRQLLRTDKGLPKRLEWNYPGLISMQCVTLTSQTGVGLYLACDDPADFLKDFAVFSLTNASMNLEIRHRPEHAAGWRSDYTLPYSVVLGTFRGDWFNAAQLYRTWATNQTWAKASRLQRGLVPAWVTNTALWVWNRGPSPGVIDPAVALQKELGLPVSVFWHWWHGCAYDTGFPEYLPPREGETPFKAALQRAHENDVHAIVYMNQRLWGMTTASWTNENAERFAVKNGEGKVRPEVYNTFTKQPCASMCMGTAFWRGKYADLASTAVMQLGVDGIYMDQACSSLACFDPHHGHAIGGGTYWMKGFQTLAADLRKRSEPRGQPALAGEGCGENWLAHLDLMLALQVSHERYAGADGWETIPFFHSVYHDYAVFFGNYSSLTLPPYDELWPAEFAPQEPLKLLDRKFSTQFRLEQARALVWGQQPTIANFRPSHLGERAEEIAFVLRLARLRALATKYLLHGQLLPPLHVIAPAAEIPMSRLSIYAGQHGGLKEFTKTVPLVQAALWRAPDRSVAIAIANLSDRPQQPRLELDGNKYGLPRHGGIYRLDERGGRRLGSFRGRQLVLEPELAPNDACVLELKPE